jgi:hypothetical protein
MFNFKINYYISHESNLNPSQNALMVGPKVALFISTQIHHLTLKVGFIWYVCIHSPFHPQPFFDVIVPI